MGKIATEVLRFDGFALDLRRGCLRAGGQDLVLRPKTFEVLRYLAMNAERLVPKQELLDAVWPRVIVSDDSLVQCIRELRDKLGDDGHQLIKNLPRRGYLLDAKVDSHTQAEGGVDAPRKETAAPFQEAPSEVVLHGGGWCSHRHARSAGACLCSGGKWLNIWSTTVRALSGIRSERDWPSIGDRYDSRGQRSFGLEVRPSRSRPREGSRSVVEATPRAICPFGMSQGARCDRLCRAPPRARESSRILRRF